MAMAVNFALTGRRQVELSLCEVSDNKSELNLRKTNSWSLFLFDLVTRHRQWIYKDNKCEGYLSSFLFNRKILVRLKSYRLWLIQKCLKIKKNTLIIKIHKQRKLCDTIIRFG